MMARRWISAIAALLLLFGTIHFFGDLGLLTLSLLFVFLAAFEYSALFDQLSAWTVLFLILNALVVSTFVFAPDLLVPLLMMSFVFLCSAAIFCSRTIEPKVLSQNIQWTALGLLYVGLLPALALSLLYNYGWVLLLFLLVTVFFGDIFAFFFGLTLKGAKLFPTISPNKTISGSLGGLIGSVICGGIYLYFFSDVDMALGLSVCVSIGAFAQLGDFFESLLKRVAGKKDSGHLMPGHGGILDRLDGVYFGSAILYFFCSVFDLARYF